MARIGAHQTPVNITVKGTLPNPDRKVTVGSPNSSRDLPKAKGSQIGGAPAQRPDEGFRSRRLRNSWKNLLGRKPSYGLAPAAMFQGGSYGYGDSLGWNDGNAYSSDDTGKERGNVPGHSVNSGVGSGNYQFDVPLVSLDGRGIDLKLELEYNARVWHKAYNYWANANQVTFDIDRDWPAPGFNLGFGKLINMGNSSYYPAGNQGYILVDNDGTRHPYAGVSSTTYQPPNYDPENPCQGCDLNQVLQNDYTGYTVDGTFIDYFVIWQETNGALGCPDPNNNATCGVPEPTEPWQYGRAFYPNGMIVTYGAADDRALYPKQILDVNGNYLTITYLEVNGKEQGPKINLITDTLGRVVKFHYDTNGLLTAITAPGYKPRNGTAADRVVAWFEYESMTLGTGWSNYGFSSSLVTKVATPTFNRLRAILYPGDNTGYWFDDPDSYSSYGMLNKVSLQRGMSCSNCSSITNGTTSPVPQATISSGSMSQEMKYNYPTTDLALTDVPTYTQMEADWAARDTPTKAITTYNVYDDTVNKTRMTTVTSSSVTLPDGTTQAGAKSIEIVDNDPAAYTYGLVKEDRAEDANGHILQKTIASWEVPGNTQYPYTGQPQCAKCYLSARPKYYEVYDERNQKTKTEYQYGTEYNQVTQLRELDYGGTTLRRKTVNEYLSNSNYTDNHVFNLVTRTDVWGPSDADAIAGNFNESNFIRVARTEFQYDQNTLQNYNSTDKALYLTSHDPYYDPNSGYYWTLKANRGLVTSVKKYSDAQNLTEATAVSESRTYDFLGNLVKASMNNAQFTVFNFTPNTKWTWASSQTFGAESDSNKQNSISAVFDFNTGLGTDTTDADGRPSTVDYLVDKLRPEYKESSTGAYDYHMYDDGGLVIYDFTYEDNQSGGNFATRTDKYVDGLGRVHGEIAYGKDYVLDIVDTQYDQHGRIFQQTKPYRYTGPNSTKYWFKYWHDPFDRVSKVVSPDNSVVERYYNQYDFDESNASWATRSYPSAATSGTSGTTMSVKDQWGRERWARSDADNRMVEVVEPDPGGNGTVDSGGYQTKYFYSTLGNLIKSDQAGQLRTFRFDSLGRMTHQKLAEREATLDDNGTHVGGSGAWSDVFQYDTLNNLVNRYDARGVRTFFEYNVSGSPDPMNRLQAVQYIKSSAASGITDAPNVTYAYKTSGDKTRVQNVYVDYGFGNQTMNYDSEGRLSQVSTSIPNRGTMTMDYQYDTLNRINLIRYPAKDNVDGVRKEVVPTYDVASRPNSLSYSGVSMVTNPVYNASSQTEQLSFGNSTSEEYTYDALNGLLTRQKVKKGTDTHLDLSYDYLRSGTSTGKTGHLTKIIDNLNSGRNREYTYDKIGRLTSVIGGANLWTMSYAYDQWGNRQSVTKTGGNGANGATIPVDGLASVSYNTASNRITNTGFTYDAAGNQTQAVDKNGDTIKYVYDSANRLIQVLKVISGSDVEMGAYEYGSSNQRLRAKENGVETYYAADGSGVIAEFQTLTSNSWQWKKNYVKWGDRLVATETADGLQYHHPDRLGTKLITNSSGGDISEQAHLPFGTALPQTSTFGTGEGYQSTTQPNPHQRRFTSYERSTTTNLDYAVNRHYAAEQGRFTQVDPIGMAAVSLENPQTLNLYAYCANDPINNTDPSGLLPKWLGKLLKFVMVVISVIAAVMAVLTVVNSIGMILELGLKKALEQLGTVVVNGVTKKSIFKGLMVLLNQVGTAITSVASLFKKNVPILGFINSMTGFLGDWKKTAYKWFKIITGTASQVAQWASAKRVSAVLGLVNIIDSLRNLQSAFANDIGKFTVEEFKYIHFIWKTWKWIKIGINSPFNKAVAVLLWLPAVALAKLFPGNTLPADYLNVATHLLRRLALYEQWLSIKGKIEGVGKAFRSSTSSGSIASVGTGFDAGEEVGETPYGSNDRRFGNLQPGPFLDYARGGIK